VIGDAAKLPLRNGSVDLIVSNLGVNNLADSDAALAECARVAKPGGVLALSTNLRGHWSEFRRGASCCHRPTRAHSSRASKRT
jgi:ubiquinone/menaquinone biosynthesis C-methylase UbiE